MIKKISKCSAHRLCSCSFVTAPARPGFMSDPNRSLHRRLLQLWCRGLVMFRHRNHIGTGSSGTIRLSSANSLYMWYSKRGDSLTWSWLRQDFIALDYFISHLLAFSSCPCLHPCQSSRQSHSASFQAAYPWRKKFRPEP